MKAAGDLANGIYFVGAAGASLTDPASITDPRSSSRPQLHRKAAELGMPAADITKGFGASGWSNLMTIWEQTNIIVNEGGELTPETFKAQMGATSDNHIYGSVPFGCADAPAPLHGGVQQQGQSTRSGTAPS